MLKEYVVGIQLLGSEVNNKNSAKAIKDKGGILIRVNRLIGKIVYVIENEQPFQNWHGVVESYNGNNFYNVINNDDDVVLVHKNQITLLLNGSYLFFDLDIMKIVPTQPLLQKCSIRKLSAVEVS